MIHNWKDWKKDYQESWSDYIETTKKLDGVLYELCKKYPFHSCKGEIKAKVTIIGRTYGAGLERHTTKDLDGVVDFFYNNRQAIDNIFRKLRIIREPLSEEKLIRIVSLHGQFLSILQRLTRNQNSIRSFASKYMHFHCSAVPIYDDIAQSVIKQKDWYPLTNLKINKFLMPPNADDVYYKFCVRFLAMYNDLKQSKFEVGVKRIDHYLLWSYEE